MKRLLALIAALLLLSAFVIPVLAAREGNFSGNVLVIDDAGLLSSSQREALETQARSVSAAHGCEVAIVTVNSIGSKTAQDYADDRLVYDNYGWGDDHSCILLLINMGERDWAVSQRGIALEAFTDDGVSFLIDRFLGTYNDSHSWNDAFKTYLDYADRILGTYDGSLPEDDAEELDDEFEHYMGYDTDRDRESKPNYLRKGIFSVLLGGLGGFVPVSMNKSGMKTVRKKRDASGYRNKEGLRLDVNQDIYLYSNVSVVRIQSQPPKSGGGGGHSITSGHTTTHVHSSGVTLGGHSGKF